MVWERYSAVGKATIAGVWRDGIAWWRDPIRHKVAFHAWPLRISFNPESESPPKVEQFVIDEDDFKPL